MKRDIFRFLLSAVLVMCCTVMTWAQETPPDDEIWYTSSDANVIEPYDPDAFGATIQSNTYNGGKGVIKFSGPVTKIGDDAFRKCNNLRSLTMPTTVTSIGESAFNTCSNLEEITIPKSVTSIGGYAFAACAGLTSISVLSGSIGNDAFAECAKLSTVILYDQTTGNGVTSIGEYAFRDCNILRTIKIPGTVKSMGSDVFSETSLNDVTIEDGAYIGESVFQKYSGKLTINGSLSGVGRDAFNGCTVLNSVSVTSGGIGEYAFLGCTNLSDVTLYDEKTGSGVTSIGGYAFAACAGLTSISVLSGSIGNDAFADCANLSTVILYDETTGNGVTSIGDLAFRQCGNLKKITIPGTVKSMGGNVFSETSLNDVTIEYGAYIGEYVFEGYTGTLTINGSLSGVGGNAFNGCTVLTSVSVTSGGIGDYAFADCTNLSDVTLHDEKTGSGVTSIGGYAFAACAGLTSISVLSGSIGNDAFADCANLSTVILYDQTTGNGVTSIGNFAFRQCGNLEKITIPGTVKSMGSDVFSETSLNDVTIEDGAYIGESVFQKYSGKLTINGSLSGVGRNAFNGCTVLNSVSVTSGGIGEYAFVGCSNLSDVTLYDEKTGSGVTSIGGYAFAGCAGLTSISVLSGSIGNDAFADCANLSTVTLGEGVTSIEDYAFSECDNLRSIKIPGTVKSMGGYVFSKTYLNDVTIEDGAYIGESVFQNYKEKLKINGSLSGVGRDAFNGCTVLTTISVSGGSIGKYAFAACTGLTSVSVTSGSIGNDAFAGCANLSTVTLGEGVTSIEGDAFESCTNLKDIFVKWTEAEKIPTIESSVFNNIDLAKVTLHVPIYTPALYNAKDVWKDFNVYEDVNFIITKTDDTTIEQKVMDGSAVTIDESEDDIKSLAVSVNAANVSVTYVRNFVNADKWQGWYVPFDVPLADMTKAGLDVAKIYGILLDNSGNTVIAFLKMEEGTVKANTPYVVRPNTSGKVTLTTTTKLYQTEEISMFMMSIADKYTIGGIYEQTVGDNWYAINKDGQFQKMGADVPLRPLRIWMTIDPRHDNPYEQSASANAKMDIVVIGDGEPTGITSYENDNENDNIYGSTGSPTMYNLNGQRVESQLSILNSQLSISNGHRGIVIRNGKKYLVR